MSAQAYPLQWPDHMPRTAIKNVVASLKAFAAESRKPITDAVMSSNIDLLNDKPGDPGVAVWFQWDGFSVCIPIDRYRTPAENLQAIHHIVEARRTEMRHGTLHLVRASFHGFKALPPPPGAKPKRPWWDVLEISPTADSAAINRQFQLLAQKRHPDKGGSDAAMAELNQARAEALQR